MSISAEKSKVVYSARRASGVRLVSALAETWLVHLAVWDDIAAGGLEVSRMPCGG